MKLNHQCRATRRAKVDGPAGSNRFSIGSTTGMTALGALGQGQHLFDSIVDEFAENEDLPNTTNPDDWARISGKKGERIVYIRTLVTGKNASASRAIDTEANTGQYL